MLATELKTYTKVCEFDDLGMLRKTEVHCAGTPILSDVITYKKNGEKTTMCVANEKFTHNDSIRTRAYTTDLYGRVTAVSDTVLGNHTYEYDYRGFLVIEDNKIFEYDGNGNITRAGDKVFTYDSVIKDRLMSVGGKPITYSESNPLNPQTYDGKTFEFEGRRLVKITSDNMVVIYKYDASGLRTEKTVTENGVTTTTKFVYDGGKLIAEYTGTRRVAYLYDENGMLYGFIYNNAKYFYIRDALQNILGIVDANGTAVVHYDYSAYGECKAIIGSKANTVGSINSFRYKGYYFDNETGFFYCKSRYYVPQWCRWLNCDSILYLNVGVSSPINLSSYCENSPIVYYDPFGTSTFSIGFGFFIGIIGGYSGSILLSSDSEGMLALQWTYSVPNNEKTRNTVFGASAGVGVIMQVTNLESVDELNGSSTSTGVNALVGVDAVSNDKDELVGAAVSVSLGCGADFHINETQTGTIGRSFKSFVKWLGDLLGV